MTSKFDVCSKPSKRHGRLPELVQSSQGAAGGTAAAGAGRQRARGNGGAGHPGVSAARSAAARDLRGGGRAWRCGGDRVLGVEFAVIALGFRQHCTRRRQLRPALDFWTLRAPKAPAAKQHIRGTRAAAVKTAKFHTGEDGEIPHGWPVVPGCNARRAVFGWQPGRTWGIILHPECVPSSASQLSSRC